MMFMVLPSAALKRIADGMATNAAQSLPMKKRG